MKANTFNKNNEFHQIFEFEELRYTTNRLVIKFNCFGNKISKLLYF